MLPSGPTLAAKGRNPRDSLNCHKTFSVNQWLERQSAGQERVKPQYFINLMPAPLPEAAWQSLRQLVTGMDARDNRTSIGFALDRQGENTRFAEGGRFALTDGSSAGKGSAAKPEA